MAKTTDIDLKSIKKVHFTGIGGVSMSGLAEILHTKGYDVKGSDIRPSGLTDHLTALGIEVVMGQTKENVTPDTDLLVYTNAVHENNPELLAAAAHGVRAVDRAVLLGLIMEQYKCPINIAGTHGKTTTTSMISEILLKAGKDPTITVGGVLNTIGGNFRMGRSEYFVVESCEYFDNFLKFYPHIGVILNIEKDHIDYFKTMAHLENSFSGFARNIDKDGCLVINSGIKNLEKIVAGVQCPLVYFGDSQSGYGAEHISYSEMGLPSFDIIHKGAFVARIDLQVPGEHNIKNALAACAAAAAVGIGPEHIKAGISGFQGTGRRFEYKGEAGGVKIIDDYAHHPTEIATTLNAAAKMAHNKLYCVFQPHTYTRTKAFLEDFALSFDEADCIVLVDIYSAREADAGEIHSRNLLDKLLERGKEAYYFPSFEEAENFLLKKCIPNDLLITMGAGDVHFIGEHILCTDLSTLSTDF